MHLKRFGLSFLQYLQEETSVEVLTEAKVHSFKLSEDGKRVESVRLTNGKEIEADLFVIAAASHSAGLCQKLGITLPLLPIKGYSLYVHGD